MKMKLNPLSFWIYSFHFRVHIIDIKEHQICVREQKSYVLKNKKKSFLPFGAASKTYGMFLSMMLNYILETKNVRTVKELRTIHLEHSNWTFNMTSFYRILAQIQQTINIFS